MCSGKTCCAPWRASGPIAGSMPDGWTRAALTGLAGDFARLHETIAQAALGHRDGLDGWLADRPDALKAADALLADLTAQPGADLARLTVAERTLRALVG